ncbi:MAG: curli production assembly/transport component CsgF [Bacteroidales bacterium]
MKKIIFSVFVSCFLMISAGYAQDFVYQPINSAFGGNYLNYQWMLSSAQVQNPYEEEGSQRPERDPLAEFEEGLNRQILSQLSRELYRNYFGEGLSEGQYTMGSYEIQVAPGSDGLEVVIFDTDTGDRTTVIVPYF